MQELSDDYYSDCDIDIEYHEDDEYNYECGILEYKITDGEWIDEEVNEEEIGMAYDKVTMLRKDIRKLVMDFYSNIDYVVFLFSDREFSAGEECRYMNVLTSYFDLKFVLKVVDTIKMIREGEMDYEDTDSLKIALYGVGAYQYLKHNLKGFYPLEFHIWQTLTFLSEDIMAMYRLVRDRFLRVVDDEMKRRQIKAGYLEDRDDEGHDLIEVTREEEVAQLKSCSEVVNPFISVDRLRSSYSQVRVNFGNNVASKGIMEDCDNSRESVVLKIVEDVTEDEVLIHAMSCVSKKFNNNYRRYVRYWRNRYEEARYRFSKVKGKAKRSYLRNFFQLKFDWDMAVEFALMSNREIADMMFVNGRIGYLLLCERYPKLPRYLFTFVEEGKKYCMCSCCYAVMKDIHRFTKYEYMVNGKEHLSMRVKKIRPRLRGKDNMLAILSSTIRDNRKCSDQIEISDQRISSWEVEAPTVDGEYCYLKGKFKLYTHPFAVSPVCFLQQYGIRIKTGIETCWKI